jgi:putative ATPase
MMSRINQPLADRIRPSDFSGFFGQETIVEQGKLLRQAIDADNIPSMIFWGPPGSGKTTLAKIIANLTESDFIELSAVTSGVAELREVIKRAEENRRLSTKTILFVDEIHRWNKSQQDALLPHLERGTITLIGATTENPSFEIRNALLSRCRVFVLEALSVEQLASIIERALKQDNYLKSLKVKIRPKIIKRLAELANGDARTALNVLEYAASQVTDITETVLEDAFQNSYLQYDKDGEEHYNLISALHKSMRGSDADAALYYLARMLSGGEDPLYIARRLVRFASEDVGLANSRALEQTVAAFEACRYIGMPECGVNLAQAVVYLAKCDKSIQLYAAYNEAMADIEKFGNLPVPMHIRNAPTKLMKNLGYGKNYKYSPDHNYQEKQDYLPEKLKNKKYLK